MKVATCSLPLLLILSPLALAAGVPTLAWPQESRLSADDWADIRAAHAEAAHAIAPREDGTRSAHNPKQQWQVAFDGCGFTIHPQDDTWSWGLELDGYGREVAQVAPTWPSSASVSNDGGTLRYRWDASLTEWFINDERGLEQGWTFSTRPPGEGPLRLTFTIRGSLVPRLGAQGAVLFCNAAGGQVLHYEGLKAWDADQRPVPARFESCPDGGLAIAVDDAGARYPLTIDPVARQAYLKASNTAALDFFGSSVAIYGNTVVVGATDEDSNATTVDGNQTNDNSQDSGAAYVFVRNGGVWTQQAYLKPANTGSGDGFGGSVAISGNTIIVGASREDGPSSNDADDYGAAYVFTRSNGQWTQQAYLRASNPDVSDYFGTSVSISGNTIVVGAPGEASNATTVGGSQSNNSAPGAGAAYVFTRSGTNWLQQAYLKASNSGGEDRFGQTVSVAGDMVVIGAPWEDSSATVINGDGINNNAPEAGAAYVFTRNGITWTQQAYLKAGNSNSGDSFGEAVAISANTVVVGAPGEDGGSSGTGGNPADNSAAGSGAAYIFVRGSSGWTQQAYLKPGNTDAGDNFGAAVAISGSTVIAGAIFEKSNATGTNGNSADNSQSFSGAAYVFRGSNGTWNQQAYLKAGVARAGRLGCAVAVFGETAIAGSYGDNSSATGVNQNEADTSANFAGAAHTFDLAGLPEPVVPVVRMAYVIPANRVPQTQGVQSFRGAMLLAQQWYRDQMALHGYGPRTFNIEMEADGVTPRVHVLHVEGSDALDDLGGSDSANFQRVHASAGLAGLPLGQSGQLWMIVPESHRQAPGGAISGSFAFGGTYGSGSWAGVAMQGGDALARYKYLTDNRSYAGLTIPEVGPYPLVQDVSFPWSEQSTLSSVSSAVTGALCHELGHALGLTHDYRNDQNIWGTLMGNGMRGIRGNFLPGLYPGNLCWLSTSAARELSVNRFLGGSTGENTPPVLSIQTSGNVPITAGKIPINFTASDPSGLVAAQLIFHDGNDAYCVEAIELDSDSFSGSFTTPYFHSGTQRKFEVAVLDRHGNRTLAETLLTPTGSGNRAPMANFKVPKLKTLQGESIMLDASGSSDPDGNPLQYEWDLNGDGAFDTSPASSAQRTVVMDTIGVRKFRVRVRDSAGVMTVSAPLLVAVVPVLQLIGEEGEILPGSLLPFGEFGAQDQETQVLTIVNLGASTISGVSVGINGDHARDFTTTQPYATTLAAGASASFSLTFAPSSAGLRTALLSISYSGSAAPVTVTLQGQGRNAGNGAIRLGPIVNPANQHTYYLLNSASWTDSEATAVSLGGHLATVRNAAEQGWITSQFGSESSLWIGLSDHLEEGVFRWASGEVSTYTNYLSGEPNGSDPTEDHIMVWDMRFGDPFSGKWNDISNSNGYNPLGVVEVTGSPATADAWKLFQFGTLAGGGSFADLADPDGDGSPNLLEYAFGSDPFMPAAGTPVVSVVPGDERLRLSFYRRKAATQPGITYTAEFSATLASGDWQQSASVVSVVSIDSGWEWVTIQDSLTVARARFGRVRVERSAGP